MFSTFSVSRGSLHCAVLMAGLLILGDSAPLLARTLFLCHFDSRVAADFANSGAVLPESGAESVTISSEGKFAGAMWVGEGGGPVWRIWDCFHPDHGTLEFWFKPAFDIRADRPGSLRTICALGHQQGEEFIGLRLMAKQTNEVWLGIGGHLEPIWDGIFIDPQHFYHVALTWQITADGKAAQIDLYVDGVRRSSVVRTLDIWPRQARLSVGAQVMGVPGFPGLYDELRVSDEVLYQGERSPVPDKPFPLPTEKPFPVLTIPPVSPARTFHWFNPAMIYLVGGYSPGENALANPPLLYANLINATLYQTKAFPGRRVGLSMFFFGDIRKYPKHEEAIRRGLKDAIKIAGGPDRVIFIPILSMPLDDKIGWLRSIRQELGCHVGVMDFIYWGWRSVRSRSIARVTEALLLDPALRDYQGDYEDELFRKLDENGMVYVPLVSGERGSPPNGRYLIDGRGNRIDWDFTDPEVLEWWRECITLYARFFSKYRSFVGVALDEPCVDLRSAPFYSEACRAAFRRRFGHEPMPFPEQEADRRGPEYLKLMRFALSIMTDFNLFCRRVLHDAAPGSKYVTPQVSTRLPQGGCDHTVRFLDILCCDSYSFFDHQLVYILMDSQLNDDCLDKVNPAHVTIVHPRRASWKYWNREGYLWLHGEPASFNKSFRRWTPLVENITDDILFDHLDSISGVLVWPIARVTSTDEDERLVEWVKRGNVLLLSGTRAYDFYLDEKINDLVLAAAGLSAGDTLLSLEKLSLDDGRHITTGRTAKVQSLKVLNKRARIFARVSDQPIGVLSPVGKGWVVVAFGTSSGIDYPTNVEIDPYLCELAKEVLRVAERPLASLSAPSGQLQFLATDSRFLHIFLPGGGTVTLSRRASAYDPTAASSSRVMFESLDDGVLVKHYKDTALVIISPEAGNATLRIIREGKGK